jgi:hypothetical protein
MPSWIWVVIAIVVVVVLAGVVWQTLARRRTGRLRQQFGPEYDRAVRNAASRRDGEAELQAREEHRQSFEIRPLSAVASERYVRNWQNVQSQFVDDPRGAVAAADGLIQAVMVDCGYPVADFEQRAADISVDHPQVVENYRRGHSFAEASAGGSDSTEDLRQAMRHYRALFDELVEPAVDQSIARDRLAGQDDVADRQQERTAR